MMRIATELTTIRIDSLLRESVPESSILLAGTPTGKLVSGAVLEAAVQIGETYLLFMTDDVPFEESLGLFLLDAKLDCIDSARIGCMYATGIFANLTLMEANTIRFQFLGEYNWTVVVHQKPQWRIPLFFSQPWISRPFQLTGHFSVRSDALRGL